MARWREQLAVMISAAGAGPGGGPGGRAAAEVEVMARLGDRLRSEGQQVGCGAQQQQVYGGGHSRWGHSRGVGHSR